MAGERSSQRFHSRPLQACRECVTSPQPLSAVGECGHVVELRANASLGTHRLVIDLVGCHYQYGLGPRSHVGAGSEVDEAATMSAAFVGELVEGEMAGGLHVVRHGAGIRAVKDRFSVVEPPARPIAGVSDAIAPHTVKSAPEHLVPGIGIRVGRVVDHAGAVQPDGQDVVFPRAVVFDQTEVRLLPVEPVSNAAALLRRISTRR